MTVTIDFFNLFLGFLLTINCICGIIALWLSVSAQIQLKAMKESTHNLEYVPIDPNWASSDKDIEKFSEAEEAELPELDDDELLDVEANLRNLI